MTILHSPIFIILISIFSIIILILLASNFECRSYVLTFYKLFTNKVKGHFRIIFFSDFHNKLYKNENELINKIISLRPNFIVIGGDLIEFSSISRLFNNPQYDNAIKFIKKLSNSSFEYSKKNNYNNSRIIFSLGNHESRLKEHCPDLYNHLINLFNSMSLNVLDGKAFDTEFNISFFGFNLHKGFYGKFNSKPHLNENDFNKCFLKLNNNKFNIALFHKPDYINDLFKLGFDLILSGHNHGGLIKFFNGKTIFSPDFKLFPKYNYGLYKFKEKFAIVTNGLGEHFLKIRINNKPEITVIDIN